MEDLRALMRSMEDGVRQQQAWNTHTPPPSPPSQFHTGVDHPACPHAPNRLTQGAPPRSDRELALLRAMDAMDAVVRSGGRWDEARPAVAEALRETGLADAARVAAPVGAG